MNTLICPAERADIDLHVLYDCIGESFLAVGGVPADRAQFTHAGQCPVQGGDVLFAHESSPFLAGYAAA